MAELSKIIQEWFRFSRQDLLSAKTLMDANNSNLYSNIGFLCQQSVEKAVKGLLAYNKVKFGKIHDMDVLGQELVKIYPDLVELMKQSLMLTPFAVEFRYPESADQPLTLEMIEQAYVLAEKIYDELSSRIPFDSGFSL